MINPPKPDTLRPIGTTFEYHFKRDIYSTSTAPGTIATYRVSGHVLVQTRSGGTAWGEEVKIVSSRRSEMSDQSAGLPLPGNLMEDVNRLEAQLAEVRNRDWIRAQAIDLLKNTEYVLRAQLAEAQRRELEIKKTMYRATGMLMAMTLKYHADERHLGGFRECLVLTCGDAKDTLRAVGALEESDARP